MARAFKGPHSGAETNTTERIAKSMGDTRVIAQGHERVTCAECGEVWGETWQCAGELASLVMSALVCKSRRLTKEEFTYLRKRNGWKSNELAASLGVTPPTVSRWESGAVPIQSPADRALRLIVVATARVGLFDTGELAQLDDTGASPLELELELTEAGWLPARVNRKASQ